MPTKQQRRDKRPMVVKRANLGQKEAELEKLGKEQMRWGSHGKTPSDSDRRKGSLPNCG
jgi:hypothetical protein